MDLNPSKTAETTAPRVSEERINALVASLKFETAHIPNTNTTIATATLPNGFNVALGMSACVSALLFDAEKGRKYAIKNAVGLARQKLWEFEGYVLARQLEALGSTNQVIHPSYSQVHPSSALPSKPVGLDYHRAQLDALGKHQAGQPNADYPPHQQRVLEEHQELKARIEKLRAFQSTPAHEGLDCLEKNRLYRQLTAMQTYANILAERIAAFGSPA